MVIILTNDGPVYWYILVFILLSWRITKGHWSVVTVAHQNLPEVISKFWENMIHLLKIPISCLQLLRWLPNWPDVSILFITCHVRHWSRVHCVTYTSVISTQKCVQTFTIVFHMLRAHIVLLNLSAHLSSYARVILRNKFLHASKHYENLCMQYFDSLWRNYTIWCHGHLSSLVQVLACCLMALSQHLNQCWLIINQVPRNIF